MFYALFSYRTLMFNFEVWLLSAWCWGRLYVGSFGVIIGCIDLWLVQLQCSSLTSSSLMFRNRNFLATRLLARFVARPWLHVQALHHMKPTTKEEKWRRWSRQAWRYFFCFSLSWERKLLPVSDECSMVHRDSWYARPECNQLYP